MKYLIFTLCFILVNCTSTKRAGGLYNPDTYTQIRTEEQDNQSVVKQGIMEKPYHSALGNLCTKYTNNHNQTLVCDNGEIEKQVRILQ
jgi:hypothetical protein